MAKELSWNVESQGITHQIKFSKNQIYIDAMEGMKLKEFQSKKINGHTEYAIPVNGDTFYFYVNPYTAPVLTHDGVDCKTNEPFVPTKLPKWIWVFWILYIIDFMLLCGGALGGAMNAGGACLSAAIASDKKKSTAAKVFICLGMWLVFTIIEFIVAFFATKALYGA